VRVIDASARNGEIKKAQPEGLPESSRWSEAAETTGKVISHDRTPEGCQTSGQLKDLYGEGSGTPPRCDPINLAFPVVSADSDHRKSH
jgi:hypothetical protein